MRIDVLVLDSNTFHLLTANVVAGCVEPIDDATVAVRIDDRLVAESPIAENAYQRGMTAIATLLVRCEVFPVSVATGAFRAAANARVFLDDVNRRFGLHVGRLSDDEEARLATRGVRLQVLAARA